MEIPRVRMALHLSLIFLGVIGCSRPSMSPLPRYDHRADYRPPGTPLAVTVILRSAHPFLNEWSRAIALTEGEQCVTWTALFVDSGSGSLANLYRRPDGALILADMNGRWFKIDSDRRSIVDAGWHWEEPAPGDYLGCFDVKAGTDARTFAFIPASDRAERSPYWVKDPDFDRSKGWK